MFQKNRTAFFTDTSLLFVICIIAQSNKNVNSLVYTLYQFT